MDILVVVVVVTFSIDIIETVRGKRLTFTLDLFVLVKNKRNKQKDGRLNATK